MSPFRTILTLACLLAPCRAGAGAADAEDAVILAGKTYSISLSRRTGAIIGVARKGGTGAVFRGGEFGLWSVRFRDGRRLSAAAFGAASGKRTFDLSADKGGGRCAWSIAARRSRWRSPSAPATTAWTSSPT